LQKGKGEFYARKQGSKKEIKGQTRFVVTREFGGTQTMQEAFEQLIAKKTEERILRKKADGIKSTDDERKNCLTLK